MKYSFTRTFRLEKYLGNDYAYESGTWGVTEADTPEEAEKEVHRLAKDYFNRLKAKQKKQNPYFAKKAEEKNLIQESKTDDPFKGDEFNNR